jgi:hypothetical protein
VFEARRVVATSVVGYFSGHVSLVVAV